MLSLMPPRAALLALTLCLSACAQVPSSACPPWPVAGPEVAAELARLPPLASPRLYDWLGRLAVLHDQLEACR
jgi:hypothetical protein